MWSFFRAMGEEQMDKMNFLSNLTVLLVEDDADALRQMEIMLRRRCAKTYLANNGMVGFKTWERVRPDVVVTDLKMPVMGGLELLKQLQIQKIPARVMMASTDTREGAKVTLDALELGAIDFVHKSGNIKNNRTEEFQKNFRETLYAVASSREPTFARSVNLGRILPKFFLKCKLIFLENRDRILRIS